MYQVNYETKSDCRTMKSFDSLQEALQFAHDETKGMKEVFGLGFDFDDKAPQCKISVATIKDDEPEYIWESLVFWE